MISNKNVKVWTRLTIEHFSTLKQSILNEPWPTGHHSASGPSPHIASFLHDRVLVEKHRNMWSLGTHTHTDLTGLYEDLLHTYCKTSVPL